MHDPENGRQRPPRLRRLLGAGCLVLALGIFLSVGLYAYQNRSGLIAGHGNGSPAFVLPGSKSPASSCTTPQHTPGTSNSTITSSGLKRSFILHLAPSYGKQPQAVVINYAGYSMLDTRQEQYTNMDTEADKAGFIVVYPLGEDKPPTWNAGVGAYGPTGAADDVQLTRDLLHYLEQNYCVDAHRIYVTGYSLGGGMAYRVACTLSTQIAALATVAGAFYHAPGGCQPSRPMPVLEIHGQADRYAPYNGNPAMGTAAVQVYLNVWLDHNQCQGQPQTFFQKGDVTGLEWTHCATGSTVVHYRVSDGGHTWPGSKPSSLGFTTNVINANSVIWNFFSHYSTK